METIYKCSIVETRTSEGSNFLVSSSNCEIRAIIKILTSKNKMVNSAVTSQEFSSDLQRFHILSRLSWNNKTFIKIPRIVKFLLQNAQKRQKFYKIVNYEYYDSIYNISVLVFDSAYTLIHWSESLIFRSSFLRGFTLQVIIPEWVWVGRLFGLLGPQSRPEGAVFCSLIREWVGNEFFSFHDNMVVFVSFFC